MINALDKRHFSQNIQKIVKDKDVSYMEAVLTWCEENDFDVTEIGKLVDNVIKEKIQAEACDLNYLEKTARLPGFE